MSSRRRPRAYFDEVIIELAQTESTNLEARHYIQTGRDTPVWIRAERQTGGRGRGGKPWTSENGNLYTSGIYPAFDDEAVNALCSFAAALAVYDVVKALAPQADTKIKWPNDVLVNGAKISGILLERASGPNGEFLIVGIGINIASHPVLPDREATDLSVLGAQTDPNTVLNGLIKRFEHWRAILKTQGFAPLRASWMDRAYNLGKPVRSKIGGSIITGIAEALDETGALHIRTRDDAIVKINAGDVFFL